MQIEHATLNNVNGKSFTIQMLRTTCPLCYRPVRFAIHEDDRFYREEAKHYKERCEVLAKENSNLNRQIHEILILKQKLKS